MQQDWIVQIVYVVLTVPVVIVTLCVCLSDRTIYEKSRWLALALLFVVGSTFIAGYGLKQSLLAAGVWGISIPTAVMVVRVLQYFIDGPAEKREN